MIEALQRLPVDVSSEARAREGVLAVRLVFERHATDLTEETSSAALQAVSRFQTFDSIAAHIDHLRQLASRIPRSSGSAADNGR